MTINLNKGQGISLKKAAPSLTAAFIGLGWDIKQQGTGADFDLDASIFMLGNNGKLISDQHFIFYNNLTSPDPEQAVKLMGDNRTGAGEGDDEVMIIDFRKVPENVATIVVAISIYDGEARRQNFGQVQNAYVRLVNVETKAEVLRYSLQEHFSSETALIMAEVVNEGGEWRLNAVGDGYQGGLQTLLDRYQ
ncbi:MULTISPECIES: TerD family protein [Cyanophyceae]|uniref:TerD family protein n=1 Tax=Cyanophyceae TaxID=3028117 RepID=UPI0007458DCD|nr:MULTISPECIES: TerD family protein [Cyanophyceae]AMA08704.1 chemical-damaging agent resistance protein C [Picosynechococcus sp. PCC 73109]ANV86847.1 chemical-damaging agent resistance protein C [Picosynechococcus sp. PCC 7117]ANV90005.1 chemical-damaging agent resistance protein C [Picosynechococcus sp. PCC 8807]QCS49690.1 TerD family protein [Picosynechococcus sp. PCC 11901]